MVAPRGEVVASRGSAASAAASARGCLRGGGVSCARVWIIKALGARVLLGVGLVSWGMELPSGLSGRIY